MTSRQKFWVMILCSALGVLAGVGFYTFHFAQGLSYMGNDPRTCRNCHIMQEHYDSWGKGSHHSFATCNDCHVPHELIPKYMAKASNGFWHSTRFTLQDFEEPIRIKKSNWKHLQHNCIRCHEEMVGEIAGHRDTEMESVSCVQCHVSVGHEPKW